VAALLESYAAHDKAAGGSGSGAGGAGGCPERGLKRGGGGGGGAGMSEDARWGCTRYEFS
jgi:hypothetical protein